ncbi:MAG: hypothetical protein PVH72_04295, partial [Desulfobacterales bacterium]
MASFFCSKLGVDFRDVNSWFSTRTLCRSSARPLNYCTARTARSLFANHSPPTDIATTAYGG